MDLRPSEIRVLGCLLEKQRTTPDSYPLTLNALRLACNQATNRDPVVDYDDDTIREAVHRLERRGLARLASGAGSRAPKFRHLLPDRIAVDESEQALLCVLMLRGAQTPGELKQRTDRIGPFDGLDAVQDGLERLVERGLAARRPRRPGQKEQRYAHLLADDGEQSGESPIAPDPHAAAADPGAAMPAALTSTAAPTQDEGARDAGRLDELLRRVQRLEREVQQLRSDLGA